jgi:CHAT domain-containing protein
MLLAKPLATISPWEQVIIIPDSILAALPFEALVVTAGLDYESSIFMGDQRILRYYPSATVLAQQRGRPAKSASRPLLALGNPIYCTQESRPAEKKPKAEKNTTTTGAVQTTAPRGYLALAANLAWGPTTQGKTGDQGIVYPPLPESATAIQEIARLFEINPELPDVLLGAAANETQLRQAPLQDYRYLHFAAHTDLTGQIQGILEPFILLGQTGNKSPDNGILTFSKVLELDLGAQMVVLTPGRLGPGKALTGDGVINLARAFFYAGARSILINLWDNKPEVSQAFLVNFYRHLKDGKSPSEALRAARFDIRRQYPDPIHWAGFVLYGE